MADRLVDILKYFSLRARVFQAGPLCRPGYYDQGEGFGFIHVLREGALRIDAPSHPQLFVDEPCVFFYMNPLGGEGAKGISNMLWPSFEFSWPMLQTPSATEFPPPEGIISPWHIPLLNTILLVSSSITVHFAHTALKNDNRSSFLRWLLLTILLGFAFVFFQIEEYIVAYTEYGLTLNSGVYGATFFMLTGFHGAHVTIGATMLAIMLIRAYRGHFSKDDHFGFEAASWYWHFVDVVWLGLFLFVYII